MSLNDLQAFMASKGLPIHEELLVGTTEIKRYSSRNNRDKDEFYIIYEMGNNHLKCLFGTWRGDVKYWWDSYEKGQVDNEEAVIKEITERYLAEREKIRQESRKKAKTIWEFAEQPSNHPYLQKKKLPGHMVRQRGDSLVIPLYNTSEEMTGIQFINPEGEKRFLTGTTMAGSYLVIGNIANDDFYYIAEGYATAASIFEATGVASVCAFSCNNLTSCGVLLKNSWGNKTPILAQDKGQAGQKSAIEWKKSVNDQVRMPDIQKEKGDFSDVYLDIGIDAVKKQLRPFHYQALTVKQILKMECPPIVRLNKYFTSHSMNIIYGAAGVGKSRICYEWALCLSLNEPFMNTKNNDSYRCLYVDAEMPLADTQQRLKPLLRRYSDCNIDPEKFKMLSSNILMDQGDGRVDLFCESHRQKIEKIMNDADVIFLDNFNTLTSIPEGDSFAKHAYEWDRFFKWTIAFKNQGKCIVLICHPIKSGHLQGGSQMRNDMDLILKIDPVFEEDEDSLCHFSVSFDKARRIPIYLQKKFEGICSAKKGKRGWEFR